MRRQILNRSLLTVAAAGSILAVTGGYAHADSGTQGGANEPRHSAADRAQEADASAGASAYGATTEGSAYGSPGVLSGNNLNIPVQAPVNICGNSVDAVALLNAASGNSCANVDAPATPAPPVAKPAPKPEVDTQLAETGSSRGAVGAAAGGGAALLLGGAMVYRRSTRGARTQRANS